VHSIMLASHQPFLLQRLAARWLSWCWSFCAASFRYRPVIVFTLAQSAGAVPSPYQTPKAL
jgi:hypothetical protein